MEMGPSNRESLLRKSIVTMAPPVYTPGKDPKPPCPLCHTPTPQVVTFRPLHEVELSCSMCGHLWWPNFTATPLVRGTTGLAIPHRTPPRPATVLALLGPKWMSYREIRAVADVEDDVSIGAIRVEVERGTVERRESWHGHGPVFRRAQPS
jgi:hypothetical protein